jgi:hypothetical protein
LKVLIAVDTLPHGIETKEPPKPIIWNVHKRRQSHPDTRPVRRSDAAGRVPEGGSMADDDLDARTRRGIEALIELLKPEGRQSSGT